MLIKQLILNNVRSFETQQINFNPGSTLLTGDIGSGKTSILLGIEFGLFGLQPGQRGSSILRNGEETGGVKLTIEVDEKIIEIERTLKKGKTVSQDYAAITIDGQKEEMSVTELKARVLAILNYPQELSKKQNILYKFTVYTPQEEMKQIITEDPQTRLNTLRHVFGIDKYKKVLENISIIRLKIREEKRLLEGATQTLDTDKLLLEKKQKILEEKESLMIPLTEELMFKIENRIDKEKDKEEITKKLEGRGDLKAKLGQSQGMLHSKEDIFQNNTAQITILKKEIQEYKLLNFNESGIHELEESILIKRKQKEKLSQMELDLNSQKVAFTIKIRESENLESKMQNLETCPTCHQNVDAVYRANVLNKTHNEKSQAKAKIEQLGLESFSIKEKIRETELAINLSEKKMTDLKILKMKLEGIKEKELRLESLTKQNKAIEGDTRLLMQQIELIKKDLLDFTKFDNIFEEKSRQLALIQREERVLDIKLAESKKDIEMSAKNIEELKERISKVETLKEKLIYYTDLENWLNKKFIPLITGIERNVMISLKHEFTGLFSEWFNTLVPENFQVRLSEDFSPIIEQKDFEIDYAYLSGGERTAIALAYRLALNQTINSLMSNIKTRDLVILDEPTDGFSSEQLDKMREVLDELSVEQLIIVSHEQKIEGFVENVIKFKKDYGISKKI